MLLALAVKECPASHYRARVQAHSPRLRPHPLARQAHIALHLSPGLGLGLGLDLVGVEHRAMPVLSWARVLRWTNRQAQALAALDHAAPAHGRASSRLAVQVPSTARPSCSRAVVRVRALGAVAAQLGPRHYLEQWRAKQQLRVARALAHQAAQQPRTALKPLETAVAGLRSSGLEDGSQPHEALAAHMQVRKAQSTSMVQLPAPAAATSRLMSRLQRSGSSMQRCRRRRRSGTA